MNMSDPDQLSQDSIALHRASRGKIALKVKTPVRSREDLSMAYTPGVAAVSRAVAENPEQVWELTSRRNWVAVISDGSAVLGLGNIGPEAALPVMEGKALLFKEFAGVDSFPIVLNTQDPDEIVDIVASIAPSFGGINLEDISAPRCFYIEDQLKNKLDIPVMHDDQHGTAIVVLAGLINALKLSNRNLENVSVVISGAGAAGTAIAKMLSDRGAKQVVMVDSKGILSQVRSDLNEHKRDLSLFTNPGNLTGSLADAIRGADVFIGVSKGGIVTKDMVASMAKDPIVFAMANPTPEIMPEDAVEAGAAIVATGRSDFPNQVNNVLAFPGVFRGAIDARASAITEKMKLAAANALAEYVTNPGVQNILPSALDKKVSVAVAKAVQSTVEA